MWQALHHFLSSLLPCPKRQAPPLSDFDHYLLHHPRVASLDIDHYPSNQLTLVTYPGEPHWSFLFAFVHSVSLRHNHPHSPLDVLPPSLPQSILKYYRKRHLLFSRFDQGICIDNDSWFSVTPQKVAEHIASKYRGKVVLEGCCGVGGNAIQFAKYGSVCVAIDNDPHRISLLESNAKIYEVHNKLIPMVTSFFDVDKTMLMQKVGASIDVVFLSPPWGGVEYHQDHNYDLSQNIPYGLDNWVMKSLELAPEVVLFLPRNILINQLAPILAHLPTKLSTTLSCTIQIEKVYLNHRYQGNVLYIKQAQKDCVQYDMLLRQLSVRAGQAYSSLLDTMLCTLGQLLTTNCIFNNKDTLSQLRDDQLVRLTRLVIQCLPTDVFSFGCLLNKALKRESCSSSTLDSDN